MTNYRWVRNVDAEGCSSCLAADGQVHSLAAWQAAGFEPKSELLICGAYCACKLVETMDPERGDLAAIPSVDDVFEERGMSDEQRVQLEVTGQVAGDSFEILAITAGLGNGWTFGAETLQASVGLWNGVETFVDHGGWSRSTPVGFGGRSVRDLGGVCHGAEWDAERQGVKLQLRTAGPSGAVVRELAKEMLADVANKPRVGFSADVLFTAGSDKVVKTILRVLSLDLVFNPARGGTFLRALNAVGVEYDELAASRREITMANEVNGQAAAAQTASDSVSAQLQADSAAVRALLGEQQRQAALAAEAEAARAVRAQMCAYLLDSGLGASRLPAAAQEHVRKQFAGKVFEPAELTGAIDAQRDLVAALTAGGVVQGPGRVAAMFNSTDKLQAAVDDLLGAPRDAAAAQLNVQRLSGIRELYHMLTGDHDYHGGYHADRVSLATTADFAGLVKNAMNKVVVERWAQLGRAGYDWWRRVVTVEHFSSLQQITGTLVGTVGALPVVAEGAEYTELPIGDSPETADFVKYGGYIPLTLELIDRDDSRKLAAYPRELASAGIRRLSGLVAALFTQNAGVGPTLADTGALFNATAVTTAGGHVNLLTTALAAAEWEVVSAAVYNQPLLVKNATGYYGTGAKMGVNPRYVLVPRALQLTAMKVIYPTLENAANIYSENQQRGQPGDVITVPEWTDTNDWAAVVDPDIAPAIYVGERFGLLPEIFIAGDQLSPAVFTNDEHRMKVRHFNAVWVNDFRPLHKSNV